MRPRDECMPTILLVEDEPMTREQLSELLASFPARIYTAENGEQGFLQYTEIRPDIVITDIIMPIMNGRDMARRIRTCSPEAKIIAMTAYGRPEDFAEGSEFVIDYFVMKPIDIERLFEILHACTEKIAEEKEAPEQ